MRPVGYVEFGITEYYDPGRLPHAGSHDTDLSCHVLTSTYVALRDRIPKT